MKDNDGALKAMMMENIERKFWFKFFVFLFSACVLLLIFSLENKTAYLGAYFGEPTLLCSALGIFLISRYFKPCLVIYITLLWFVGILSGPYKHIAGEANNAPTTKTETKAIQKTKQRKTGFFE